MSGFTNSPIDSETLPTIDHLLFQPLAARYKASLYAQRGFTCVVVFAIGAVLGVVGSIEPWLWGTLGFLWLIGAVAAVALVPSVFRHRGWLARDHDISSRYGVFTRRLSTVPFVRVQNVSVRQSFFDRIFEIATLDVFTAGSDLHIAGLTPEDAERLRLLVLERAGMEGETASASEPPR